MAQTKQVKRRSGVGTSKKGPARTGNQQQPRHPRRQAGEPVKQYTTKRPRAQGDSLHSKTSPSNSPPNLHYCHTNTHPSRRPHPPPPSPPLQARHHRPARDPPLPTIHRFVTSQTPLRPPRARDLPILYYHPPSGQSSDGRARRSRRCRKPVRRSWCISLRTQICARYMRRRVTIMQKDIQLARRLRGAWGGMG